MRELSLVPTCASSDSRSPGAGRPRRRRRRLRPPSTTSTSSSQTLIGMSTNRWRSAWPVVPRSRRSISSRACWRTARTVEGIAFRVACPSPRSDPCRARSHRRDHHMDEHRVPDAERYHGRPKPRAESSSHAQGSVAVLKQLATRRSTAPSGSKLYALDHLVSALVAPRTARRLQSVGGRTRWPCRLAATLLPASFSYRAVEAT